MEGILEREAAESLSQSAVNEVSDARMPDSPNITIDSAL